MLDQNTTTIITTAIAAISTLIAALGGVALTNYHTTRLEKLRISQEQIKKKTKAVEEVYQTLITTDNLIDAFAYDITQGIKINLSDVERIKEIRASSVKTTILMRLYLPSLKEKMEEYESVLGNYWNAIGSLHSGKKGEAIKIYELREEYSNAQNAYKQNLRDVESELKELVKK